jgi:CheY-like chemotaxis protein
MTDKASDLVLVVEDDIDTRHLISVTLESADYQVVAAGDGEEAIRYLHSGAPLPCLILLDLMMPIMNGWEFRSAQQADPLLSQIPVVILSASSDVARHAQNLRASTYLVKPMDLDAVVEAARKYC